jgi:hypothetical protein
MWREVSWVHFSLRWGVRREGKGREGEEEGERRGIGDRWFACGL